MRLSQVISKALTKLPFHAKLLVDPYAGIAHMLVFYGFLVLFAGTCLVFWSTTRRSISSMGGSISSRRWWWTWEGSLSSSAC